MKNGEKPALSGEDKAVDMLSPRPLVLPFSAGLVGGRLCGSSCSGIPLHGGGGHGPGSVVQVLLDGGPSLSLPWPGAAGGAPSEMGREADTLPGLRVVLPGELEQQDTNTPPSCNFPLSGFHLPQGIIHTIEK